MKIFPPESNQAINMETNHQELVVGIIGCGYWGPNLIRNFNALPDCRVKWACDRDASRLNRITTLYPEVCRTADTEQVLNDPDLDAVIIATPVSTHFELARRSLDAGKHTFVEKPMARTSDECRQLIELADNRGLSLMVGHTFVYNAAVRKMKEIIDSGEIGKVLYIGSQRLNLGLFQRDINVAWDLAPHDISIILYLLGDQPQTVSCQGQAHVSSGIEDVTNMSLSFDSGTFATIQSSWLDPNKVRKMTVVGEFKMIVYDDNEPLEKLRIYDKRVEAPARYDTFGDFFYSYHYGGVYSPYIEQEEPLRLECRSFLDSIVHGAPSASHGNHGLDVVRILEAASHSLAKQTAAVRLS